MSDEALGAHLQWLDDCAKEQGMDYETWLEGKLAQLETDLAKTTRAMQAAIDAGGIAMSENARLTKHVEDYEEEVGALKEELKSRTDALDAIENGKVVEYWMVCHSETNRMLAEERKENAALKRENERYEKALDELAQFDYRLGIDEMRRFAEDALLAQDPECTT